MSIADLPILTPRQQRFVDEFLVDLNGRQAAIRAGYSPKSADQQAGRLLSYAKVKAALEKGKTERRAKTRITAERVLEELAKLAFVDPRDFFDADGNLIPIAELGDDTATGLAGLDIAVHHGGDGEVTKAAKIKFADKWAAFVDLCKHLGLFAARMPLGSDENPIAVLIRHAQGTALEVVANPPPEPLVHQGALPARRFGCMCLLSSISLRIRTTSI